MEESVENFEKISFIMFLLFLFYKVNFPMFFLLKNYQKSKNSKYCYVHALSGDKMGSMEEVVFL